MPIGRVAVELEMRRRRLDGDRLLKAGLDAWGPRVIRPDGSY